MTVTQLGYLALNSKDIKGWENMASNVLGMEVLPRRGAKGPLYLRMDERHHRWAVYPEKKNGVRSIGWEVSDRPAMERLAERLEKAGVKIKEGTKAELKDRRVTGLMKFEDPTGFNCDLFYGAWVIDPPFKPSRSMSGFVTQTQGLGHVVLSTDCQDEMIDFYENVLGFRQSDVLEFLGIRITFFRCNEREHTLAIADCTDACAPGQINHVMIEVNSLDDVGRAFDLCEAHNVPLTLTMGRHVNDLATTFYLVTPSGFAIEYGHGGVKVEDEESWTVRHYSTPSLWGHKMVGPSTLTFRPGSTDFR